MIRRALVLAGLIVAAAASGCGSDAEDAGGRLAVVGTTGQVADLARNVGGDRVHVTRLLPVSADPHDYEPRPRDVKALARAKLIVRSGGEVDDWLDGAIDSAGGDAPVLDLIRYVRTSGAPAGHEAEHGDDEGPGGNDAADPHWWQDPRNAVLAVGAIARSLAQVDPGGRALYQQRARAYERRIEALDAAVARCWRRVPAAQRKLVTTHDALGYYARRYGLEVIGTVIPSRSSLGQASAGETEALVRKIRSQGVKAVFAEQAVEESVEQAVAREAGSRIGARLWADALGPPGSGADTYLNSIASNTRALVSGVTGGAQRCELRV